jgi:hypothetical protein
MKSRVAYKRGTEELHPQEKAMGKLSKDWSDAATNQVLPARERFSPETSRGLTALLLTPWLWPDDTDVRFLAPRTKRE